MAVEARREGAKPQLRGKCCDDAAADAALGGDADTIDPLAGIVVHARTGHDRKRAGDDVGRNDLNAGHGIDAAIGERRRHHGEIARGDENGALPEIGIEDGIDVVLQHQIIAQQPGDRAIAVAGERLRGVHGVVDVELAAGEQAELLADALECGCAIGLMDQPGAGDRAGIDHRVERPVVVGQPDRIERLPARLDPDRRRNALLTDHVERERKHEGLGYRLDGERHPAVADLIDMAVDGNETDAEMRGVGALQLGNVIGDRAGIIRFEFLVASLQKALERRLVGIAGISEGEIAFGRVANLGVHIITM